MLAVGLLIAVSFAPPAAASQAPGFAQLATAAAQARESNRDVEAIGLYRQALLRRPEWSEGLWYLGMLLYDHQLFGESRDVLRQFVAGDTEAGPGWTLLGMSEFQVREYGRALPHLQRGLALGLGDRESLARSAWFFAGALLTRMGRFDDGRSILTDARRVGPLTPFIVQAAGLAVLRLPLLPSEIAPGRLAFIELAGRGACAIAAPGGQAEGEALIKELGARYPDEPGVHFLLGATVIDSSPEAGVMEMRRELEISPGHVAARIRLAEEYLQEDKPELALPLAREAAALDPDSSTAQLTLGEALIAAKDPQGAVRALEAARGLTPDIPQIRWALSRAYSAAGRKADAAREAAEMDRLKALERK